MLPLSPPSSQLSIRAFYFQAFSLPPSMPFFSDQLIVSNKSCTFIFLSLRVSPPLSGISSTTTTPFFSLMSTTMCGRFAVLLGPCILRSCFSPFFFKGSDERFFLPYSWISLGVRGYFLSDFSLPFLLNPVQQNGFLR